MKKRIIGVIGCGNMGAALVTALARSRKSLIQSIVVFDRDRKKMRSCIRERRVRAAATLIDLVEKADSIILAVKPQNITELAPCIRTYSPPRTLIVSILAGTSIQRLRTLFGMRRPIVRTMPNVGILEGASITAIAAANTVGKKDRLFVQKLFSVCGETIVIPERLMNAVTAISGSGPAYYFYLTELLADAARKKGFSNSDADRLARKTLEAASTVLARSVQKPSVWRAKVTSPGGTTEAALHELHTAHFDVLMHRAITRAIQRAAELSR